jgi:hypothetical protein
VRDEHKRRWPREYAAFKAGIEAPLEGTPITEWPAINKAQVQTLQYLNVRTVESLAELTDEQVMKIGAGGMTLRGKAQAWLKVRDDSKATLGAVARADKLERELAAVREQLAALSAKKTKPAEAAAA